MTKDIFRQALSKSSLSYFNRVCCLWMIMALAIFFVAHYLKIDKEACVLCHSLSKSLWFIEDAATASKFTDGVRLQWLFLLFSIPIVVLHLIHKINDLSFQEMSVKLPALTLAGSVYVTFIVVFLESPRDEDHGFTGLFLNSIFPASVGSFVLFYAMSLGLIFTGLYIKAYLKYRKLQQ